MARKFLLICGVLAMLWYVAINIIVPLQDPGYNFKSQTISELSAIDASTRRLWVLLCIFYSLLFTAFGVGLWLTAGDNRTLRFIAGLVIFDSIFGAFWPPMHMRDVIAAGQGTLTDTLHIVWAFVHLIIMLLMIGFGASLFDKRFRLFSAGIVLIFIVFGILTAIDSQGIEANQPTPYIGIWERINIMAYMTWIVVFVLNLLKRDKEFVNYSRSA